MLDTIDGRIVDFDISNKLLENIKDLNNITEVENKALIFILNNYECDYKAIKNILQYVKGYSLTIEGIGYDKGLLLLAETIIKNKKIIDLDDMKNLVEEGWTNNNITSYEIDTLLFIGKKYNTTLIAKKYLENYFY